MGWPPDDRELRAVVLRICAEGVLVGENRLRPGRSRYPSARLRGVLDALVAEGIILRHDAGAFTIYIAWPDGEGPGGESRQEFNPFPTNREA